MKVPHRLVDLIVCSVEGCLLMIWKADELGERKDRSVMTICSGSLIRGRGGSSVSRTPSQRGVAEFQSLLSVCMAFRGSSGSGLDDPPASYRLEASAC